jgi:hypothetical protein
MKISATDRAGNTRMKGARQPKLDNQAAPRFIGFMNIVAHIHMP